jgi:hypothetical protein
MGNTPDPFPDCIDPDKSYDVTSDWGNCWWDSIYGEPGYQDTATQESVRGSDLLWWFGLEGPAACFFVLPNIYSPNKWHSIISIIEVT